jgi:hypothetical protein
MCVGARIERLLWGWQKELSTMLTGLTNTKANLKESIRGVALFPAKATPGR